MANQVVTMRWSLGEANRVRETLIKRYDELLRKIPLNGTDEERQEVGEIADLLARDFDWRSVK